MKKIWFLTSSKVFFTNFVKLDPDPHLKSCLIRIPIEKNSFIRSCIEKNTWFLIGRIECGSTALLFTAPASLK